MHSALQSYLSFFAFSSHARIPAAKPYFLALQGRREGRREHAEPELRDLRGFPRRLQQCRNNVTRIGGVLHARLVVSEMYADVPDDDAKRLNISLYGLGSRLSGVRNRERKS